MSLRHTARKQVSKRGQAIEHHFFERTEGDGREAWSEATGSPETITAIAGKTGLSIGFSRDVREAAVESRRVYHIRDDATSNLTDGGGNGASQLSDDGTRWIVMQSDELGNGLIRITAKRRD